MRHLAPARAVFVLLVGGLLASGCRLSAQAPDDTVRLTLKKDAASFIQVAAKR
jgi:hypothetical protein